MKTEILKCCNCGSSFSRPSKEVKRRKKQGKTNFFCSLSCFGKTNTKHLTPNPQNLIPDNGRDEYTGLRTHLKRAKQRKYECDLDLEYLLELWSEQEGICNYTKVKLTHPKPGKNNPNYTASLDRIDSSRGYIKGNVQFISITMNWAKSNLPESHILEFLKITKEAIDNI